MNQAASNSPALHVTMPRITLLGALIALLSSAAPVAAETFTWGGGNGTWRSSNWSIATFPDDDLDIALIDGGKNGTASYVTITSQGADNSLNVGALIVDAGDTAETVGSVFLNVYSHLTINGTYLNNGSTALRPSATLLGGSGRIENRATTFRGYAVTLSEGLTLENFNTTRFEALDLLGIYRASGSAGSTLTVGGALQQNGRLVVSAGTAFWLNTGSLASGGNPIEVEAGGKLRLTTGEVAYDQRLISNTGQATILGGTLSAATFDGDWRLDLGNVLSVRDRISVTDRLTLAASPSGGRLEFSTDMVLDGGGQYRLEGGRIDQRLGETLTLTLAQGSALNGYGGITTERFVNQGRLSAGEDGSGLNLSAETLINEGVLEVHDADSNWGLYLGSTTHGSFSQAATGRTIFHFDDTLPGQYGILRAYDAVLAGDAEIRFDAAPELDIWYTAMWALQGLEGEFDRVTAPTGWTVETEYTDDRVRFRVTAVPEPEVCILLGTGLGLLAYAARRRRLTESCTTVRAS